MSTTIKNPHNYILNNNFTSPIHPKEVNFYDWDGTLLFAYTIAEANALTALPTPPISYPNLTFYGWNWSLEDVRSLNHIADIGAEYNTSDGKTYLHIVVGNEYERDITLSIFGVVDWGDGSQTETVSGNHIPHTYPQSLYPAYYTITIDSNSTHYYLNVLTDDHININTILYGSRCKSTFIYSGGLERIAVSSLNFDTSPTIGLNAPIRYYTYPRNSVMNLVNNYGEHIALPKSISTQTNIYIPKTIKSICLSEGITLARYDGFENCLIAIHFPSTITSFGTSRTSNLFNNQYRLPYVKFPKSLLTITGKLVHDANADTTLVLDFSEHESVPTLDYAQQYSFASSTVVKVPNALLTEWKAASGWHSFENLIVGV